MCADLVLYSPTPLLSHIPSSRSAHKSPRSPGGGYQWLEDYEYQWRQRMGRFEEIQENRKEKKGERKSKMRETEEGREKKEREAKLENNNALPSSTQWQTEPFLQNRRDKAALIDIGQSELYAFNQYDVVYVHSGILHARCPLLYNVFQRLKAANKRKKKKNKKNENRRRKRTDNANASGGSDEHYAVAEEEAFKHDRDQDQEHEHAYEHEYEQEEEEEDACVLFLMSLEVHSVSLSSLYPLLCHSSVFTMNECHVQQRTRVVLADCSQEAFYILVRVIYILLS